MVHRLHLLKPFTIIAFLSMLTLGFRAMGSARWAVSPSDPTVWVSICSGLAGYTFPSLGVPAGDPLYGTTDLSMTHVFQSVIDDYNGVGTWYARIAFFPSDPSNPPAPQPGDSPFTTTAAADRTISVCTGGLSGLGEGGQAAPKTSGGTITGCTVTLADSAKSSALSFLQVVTHELGHCFFLNHPQESTHAIMSYFNPGVNRLQDDDKAGLSYFYANSGTPMSEQFSLGTGCSPH